MNTENMMKLAHYLELVELENFNMKHWFGIKEEGPDDDYNESLDFKQFMNQRQHFCNTTACIAGYASLLAYEESNDQAKAELDIRLSKMTDAKVIAEEWLDLESDEAYRLFFADKHTVWHDYADEFSLRLDLDGNILEWADIHPKDAAEMIRRIVSGKVLL
jgi:hypothetical protein